MSPPELWGPHLRRREFLGVVGVAAAAWPLAARAQQAPIPVIGYLSGGASGGMPGERAGFQQGLKETGLVEGRDFAIEYRSAGGQNDRLPAIVADVVARRVTVIVAVSDSYALAAKAATTSTPIVYVGGADPVSIGLVTSLSRPGGNVTGVTVLNVEIAAKRLQLLNELIPTARTIAALLDPATPSFEINSKNLMAAAKLLGLQVHILRAGNSAEVGSALEAIAERRLGPVVVGPSPFFNRQSQQLAALMVRHALPAIFQTREFVVAGGLMSYGGSLLDAFRIAGTYTGRISRATSLPIYRSNRPPRSSCSSISRPPKRLVSPCRLRARPRRRGDRIAEKVSAKNGDFDEWRFCLDPWPILAAADGPARHGIATWLRGYPERPRGYR